MKADIEFINRPGCIIRAGPLMEKWGDPYDLALFAFIEPDETGQLWATPIGLSQHVTFAHYKAILRALAANDPPIRLRWDRHKPEGIKTIVAPSI